MSSSAVEKVRWTVTDLEGLPDSSNRYEIVDGELFMTRAPQWSHQKVANNICTELNNWSEVSVLGEATIAPGIVFSEVDNVIPDVVWASYERLEILLDEAEHLTGAPELVVEVLSPGEKMSDAIAKLSSSYMLPKVFWSIGLPIASYSRYKFIDAKTVF